MDHDEKLREWSEVRAQEPDRLEAYLRPARILRDLGRVEEAETLISYAIERFPQSAEPSVEFAWIAHHARNWDEALVRWQEVRQKFVHPIGYLYASSTLVAAERLREADTLLSEAIHVFADSPDAHHDYAWITVHQGLWEEGVNRFLQAIAQFPDNPTLYTGLAICLRKLQRFTEADKYLGEAIRRFPDNIKVLQDWVAVAKEQSDWPSTLNRSEHFMALRPEQPDGYLAGIHALTRMGNYSEAEARALRALEKFPDNVEAHKAYADIAAQRGSTSDAAIRYRQLRERFPDNTPLPVSVIQDWHCPPGTHADLSSLAGRSVDNGVMRQILQHHQPKRIAQFGCGSARQALELIKIARDVGWELEVTCIDPKLRALTGSGPFVHNDVCGKTGDFFHDFVQSAFLTQTQAQIVPVGGDIVRDSDITLMSVMLRNDGQRYDLVFIDTPQIQGDLSALIRSSFGLLGNGGILIVNCLDAIGSPALNARSAVSEFAVEHFLGFSSVQDFTIVWRNSNFPLTVYTAYLSSWEAPPPFRSPLSTQRCRRFVSQQSRKTRQGSFPE